MFSSSVKTFSTAYLQIEITNTCKIQKREGGCTMRAVDISVEKFLQAFFNEGEDICIRVFSDRKPSEFKGRKLVTKLGSLEKDIPKLKEHNEENRGIFFVVNYGGNEDNEIKRVNAQFVENDELSIKEQYESLMSFPLEPSIIVKTKKSLHSYWLIKDGDVKLFREVQKKLAEHFHGDKSIVNESRVLRLPGFFHCKEEPTVVECVKFNPELKYTQQELLKFLPQGEEAVKEKVQVTGDKKGIELVTERCDFIKYCKEKAETLPEQHWYAMITNLSVFEKGYEAIHELSKLYPVYSREETDNKIEHFLRSGTGPIKCSTIADRGFKCPKLEKGECSCKSPASLVKVPLSIDDLCLFLSRVPVTGNITRDSAKAADFIEEYLSNADEIIASAFISSEIMTHFDLKQKQLSLLLKRYKELSSNHHNSKKKGITMNGELPPWYEHVENGLKFIPGILAAYLSTNVDAFYGAESVYLYDKGVYREANDLVASKIIMDHIFDRYATANGINDVLSQWQVRMHKPIDVINSNPYIINVKNGLYNMHEDKLEDHSPEYYSTVQINANYDKEAQCPKFIEFLEECLKSEDIPMVQEILGYLLIPVNKAQKSFVFVGAGHAGKSTLLSVAQEVLLGNSNVSNVPWQALSDRFKTAEIFGKLANIFADLPTKSFDDNGLFKSITGEDFITVEKKNKNPFSFRPYARLLFSCNEIPKNYGDKSAAFYRRLIILRFDKPVPPEKRDVHLKDKLSEEADGIFMWALEGLKRLIKNNFVFSESEKSKEELKKYRIECNSILSFVQDNCSLGAGKCVEFMEMFRAYKEYCMESGLSHVGRNRFTSEFRENFPEIAVALDSTSRRVIYKGIGIL
jgi:putative DNA primase/helicase